MILDPFLAMFSPPGMCKNMGCSRRNQVLKRCNDRFANELDIINLLQKVRDSYGMIRFLRGKEHKALLRFNKDRAINISESDSEP